MKFSYLTRLLLATFLIFGAIFTACQHEERELNTFFKNKNGLDIEKAKNNYDNLISTNKARLTAADHKKQKVSKKNLYWDYARPVTIDGTKKWIIPFSLKEEIYLRQEDTSNVKYSNASYFLVSKKGNTYEYEILTKIPDIDYLNADSYKGFSGKVIIENIYGDFVKGYLIKDGQSTPLYLEVSSSGARKMRDQDYCSVTDWYDCVSIDGGGTWSCTYAYTEIHCTSQGGGGGGGGGTGYGSVGEWSPSGGGGSSSPYSPGMWGLEQVVAHMCPPSELTVVGSAYYAQMREVGLTAINRYTNQRIDVDFTNTCFQVPKYNLSANNAGIRMADAVNQARRAIDSELDEGLLQPDYHSVRPRFIELIRQFLNVTNPGSTFNPSGCSGSIVQTTARYGC